MINLKQFLCSFLILSITQMLSAQDFCKFIQDIQKYQDSVKIKYNGEDVSIDTSTFNLNSYLNYFDRLKVYDNKKIDMYYRNGLGGGGPCFYAINDNENITSILDSLSLLFKGESRTYLAYHYTSNSSRSAINYLSPENSQLGFLQYLFFAIMGEKFALFWHSNYGEMKIICNEGMIDRFVEDHINNNSFSVDKECLAKLTKVSTNIVFDEFETYYTISWLENRTHSGIFRSKYCINKIPPHNVTLISEELIAEINIQFWY